MDIWVDASSNWGIGVVIGDTWDTWKWSVPFEIWHVECRDIGWAEMVAIELVALRLEELGVTNANILVCGDNIGVIGAWIRSDECS